MTWILNASPLILLGKIDRLDLLPKMELDFEIPAAVAVEIEAGAVNDPARRWIESEAVPRLPLG